MVLDQLLAVFVLATFASAVDVKGTVAVRQKLHDRLDSLEASLREARETPSALDSATGSPDGDHSPAGLAESTAYKSGVMHRAHPHSPTALRHDATAFPHTMRGTAKTTGREPKPAYVILGGSNTLGAKNVKHVPGRPWVSYAVQLAARDGWAANYSRVQNAQGAMGPTMAAGCATSFIPPSARLVTIEYLPNMGYSGDDKSELAAIERLLQVAQQRRARTLVILINPGRERFETMAAGCTGDDMVGCTTTEHSHHLRDGMLNLARQYGARSVLADCDTDRNLFGEDAMHLNQEGHNLVHSKILEHLRNWPEPPPPPVQSRPDMGVLCALGEELRQLVAESHGFTEIDMARPEQGAPKIGWESREPGGNVTLCATLPREQMKREIALKETKKYYNSKERKTELGKYMMAVGMQESAHACRARRARAWCPAQRRRQPWRPSP